jgi:hypothetical protein
VTTHRGALGLTATVRTSGTRGRARAAR